MTSITTNVKHRVRTTGSKHQGQNSFSVTDQNLGFTCIFSSGMQELFFFKTYFYKTYIDACIADNIAGIEKN